MRAPDPYLPLSEVSQQCWTASGTTAPKRSARRSSNCGTLFDCDSKQARIKAIDAEMASAGFWDDTRRAQGLVRERNDLSRLAGRSGELSRELADQIPSAELELIPGAGQVANLDAPDAFNEALRRFLDAP